jgi:hypothetical protein
MGFRLDRTYALRWDAGDLEGLEIDIRSTSVETMREVRALKLSQDETRLAEILIAHIKRWNFEDEAGETLPISVDSLLSQESVVLAAVAREWYLAAVGVSAPLDLGSTSTSPSAEESIPMEPL